MEKIIKFLLIFKMLGYEVVKSNCEQIVFNNKSNSNPLVFINDIDYLTPTPYDWYLIDNEVNRLIEKVNLCLTQMKLN